MKIGVLAQYPDTRNDIRDLLDLLSLKHEIIVYVRKSELRKFNDLFIPDITIVPIYTFKGVSAWLYLTWKYLYLLLGRIPSSQYNYYMTESIKLLNPDLKPCSRWAQALLLQLSKCLPGLISYDQFLRGLLLLKAPSRIQQDIDVFLCYTEIYHDWMFAQILTQGKPVWTYVYSWDHPCKMKTFSKKVNYLVWNQGMQEDLVKLHDINASQISVLGATQFAYVHQFINSGPVHSGSVPYSFPYLYLGCATGYDQLTRQEVNYCIQIAGLLSEVLPGWKFVVRPYPFQNNTGIYKPLADLPNVVMDNDPSAEKFRKIRHAKAFLHFGTTLGYEAAYFNTPSFLIDFIDKRKDALLHRFVHQYQNDKYLNNGPEYNVIKSRIALRAVLENLNDEEAPGPYSNEILRRTMDLQSLQTLAEKLTILIAS